MKRTLIISFILLALLVGGLFAGAAAISTLNKEEEETLETYEIIVDDVVKVYCGEENSISPYLIRSDGSAIKSRFKYECSSPEITISNDDGRITFDTVPEGKITVKITELNTGTEKTVELDIIDKLEAVLGVIAPDGNLVEGKQHLLVGHTYAITITTKPVHQSVEDYCTVVTKDNGANVKDAFDISFENDKVLLKVVGIGEGTVYFTVKDDLGEVIHNSYISFEATLSDEVLTESILTQTGKTLLSKDDIAHVKSIVVDETITDLMGLDFLTSLESVFIDSQEVLSYAHVPEKYFYRVYEDSFLDYYNSEIWASVKERITPCDENMQGIYVVYHHMLTVPRDSGIDLDAGIGVYTRDYNTVGARYLQNIVDIEVDADYINNDGIIEYIKHIR